MATTLDVLMIGIGEYTTGYVHDKASGSDKKNGVVALVCFDLRRRGMVKRLALVGTSGTKNAAIREHLKSVAGQYRDLDPTIDQFPADGAPFDAEHYKAAIDAMKPGDAVTVFTPDETHFDISLYAIRKGLHVLVAKPAVMTTQEHAQLIKEAAERKVLVMVENHKRWDPIYSDARGKIRTYGDMGFFQAFMSQPKTQLETFSKWLGKGSDISYYLNSHHVDFLCWAMQGLAVPITATAMGSTGVAKVTEDTITVMVQFKNLASGNLGTAIFTSSWVAAKKAEVHSQQRFSYMGHTGEMRVDQAHRGYEIATDDAGYASVNPLYMRYTPDGSGYFAAQQTYGYRSIEAFVEACNEINQGKKSPQDFDDLLPSIRATYPVTAILEAGRKSLDSGNAPRLTTTMSAVVMDAKPKAKSGWAHLTNGAVSGLVSCILLQPLDLVKTRLQQQPPGKGAIISTIRDIIKTSGAGGLWRGLTPTIIRNVPGTSMYFVTLSESRKILNRLWKPHGTDSGLVRPDNRDNLVNLVAGGFSRAFVGFILMPATVIKVRYESNLFNYTSLYDAARSIVKADGMKGLFYGFGATLVRDAPQAGLYVVIYEQSRGFLNAVAKTDPRNQVTASLVNMTSGMIGGIVSTVLTQPFDVAKTRIQLEPDKYRNLVQALVKVVKDEGFYGYFAGTSPRILRKALSSAITWTLYSFLTERK